jgi:uracil-DNA glycosylase family 4
MTDSTHVPHDAAGALIAWYAAMGVDSAVSDPAVDWLQRPTTPPRRASDLLPARDPSQSAPPPTPARSRDKTPLPGLREELGRAPAAPRTANGGTGARAPVEATPDDSAGIAAAAELAASAGSLAELRSALEGFDGCALKKTARSMCFMRGAEQARLMVIGEAPGRDEDRSGIPFVGRAGQLLDKMLAAIAHDETNTHITNIVYWRPPGNRTPSDVEAQICRPFLDAQIRFVDPDVILLMGGAAAKLMTGQSTGIMRMRGKPLTLKLGGRERTLMPTLHPAYLLRQPAEKRKAWQDLLATEALLA